MKIYQIDFFLSTFLPFRLHCRLCSKRMNGICGNHGRIFDGKRTENEVHISSFCYDFNAHCATQTANCLHVENTPLEPWMLYTSDITLSNIQCDEFSGQCTSHKHRFMLLFRMELKCHNIFWDIGYISFINSHGLNTCMKKMDHWRDPLTFHRFIWECLFFRRVEKPILVNETYIKY